MKFQPYKYVIKFGFDKKKVFNLHNNFFSNEMFILRRRQQFRLLAAVTIQQILSSMCVCLLLKFSLVFPDRLDTEGRDGKLLRKIR